VPAVCGDADPPGGRAARGVRAPPCSAAVVLLGHVLAGRPVLLAARCACPAPTPCSSSRQVPVCGVQQRACAACSALSRRNAVLSHPALVGDFAQPGGLGLALWPGRYSAVADKAQARQLALVLPCSWSCCGDGKWQCCCAASTELAQACRVARLGRIRYRQRVRVRRAGSTLFAVGSATSWHAWPAHSGPYAAQPEAWPHGCVERRVCSSYFWLEACAGLAASHRCSSCGHGAP